MRRHILAVLLGLVVLLGVAGHSHALLVDNGDGTVTQTRSDGSMLMWTKDAGLFQGTWFDANTWIDVLNSSNFLGLGYTDWRLPSALNADGSGPCIAFDCIGSEMGNLFYNELGGTAESSILTSVDPDFALFSNIRVHDLYWSSNDYSLLSSWTFNFHTGGQFARSKSYDSLFAWAVRTVDISAVPEPETILLLGSGLLGIIAFRRKISI